MRYENEDGRNKSDVGGSSESFLKAPRVTRQVYAETSIIPVTYFIASWANSSSPALRPAASLSTPLPPRPRPPTNGLARFRLLGSPTFLFLIDSSSVLYELPLAFVTFSLCEIYDPAPKTLATMFARRNVSALRHRVLSWKYLGNFSRDRMRISHFLVRNICTREATTFRAVLGSAFNRQKPSSMRKFELEIKERYLQSDE